MPLVLVHGVSTRMSAAYRAAVKKQEDLLVRLALRGLASDPWVSHPYWGDRGAHPAWQGASLPAGDFESFGADEQLEAMVAGLGPELDGPHPLLSLARSRFIEAIDLLWALIPADRSSTEVAELGAKTLAYAEANQRPDWLGQVDNDQQFLTRLAIEVDAWEPVPAGAAADAETSWESFGLADAWDRVSEGARRLLASPLRGAGSVAVAALRSTLQSAMATFFGDVFVYLAQRDAADGTAGPIPALIIAALDEAAAARSATDPHLVVVGHSLGGDILYDVLTHYRPDLGVDVLVTVGSQVPFFEELKLFHASRSDIPSAQTPKVSRPPGVAHWLNIFDRQDILSYSGSAVFDGINDFEYSTGASAFGAHTTYFERPSFHRRLNERLNELLNP